MSFWVYMLRCRDGSYYIGHTDNLEKRIAQHHAGEAEGYTKLRLRVRLVYFEECGERIVAIERERQLKGWSRAKKEALVKGNMERLKWLSRSKTSTGSV